MSRGGDAPLTREIGAPGVAALTLNIVMGSGLFVIPAAMGALGGWAPVAIALCALVLGAVTLAFAEASSRVPRAGGVYGIVRVALGPVAAAVVGGMIWLSGTLAAAGILAAAMDQLTPFAPALRSSVVRAMGIVVACIVFSVIALRGARQSARASEVTMAVKLVPLVLFCVVVALSPAAPAATTPPLDIATAAPLLILGVYLFAGVESGMVMNGEVRDPVRTLPRGLLGALVAYSLLAITIQVCAGRALGADLAASRAPLIDGAARANAWLPAVMGSAAVFSMLGSAAGLATANPRIIFALASDGLMPRMLARVHPTRRTPHVAIIAHGMLVALLACLGEFKPLTVAASLASMAVYVLGCGSALVLRQRGVAESGQVVAWRLTPVAAVVGVVANLAIIAGATAQQGLALGSASLLFAGIAWWRGRVQSTGMPA